MYIAAQNTNLSFVSTVNCVSTSVLPNGAMFDIQASAKRIY